MGNFCTRFNRVYMVNTRNSVGTATYLDAAAFWYGTIN